MISLTECCNNPAWNSALVKPTDLRLLGYRSDCDNFQINDCPYAKARLLPLLQNMQNDGCSWAKHKVNKSQVLKRNEYLEQSTPYLWQYACAQIDLAVAKGWLVDE